MYLQSRNSRDCWVLSYRFQRECNLADSLISNFWTPELWENKSLCVVLPYGHLGKRTQLSRLWHLASIPSGVLPPGLLLEAGMNGPRSLFKPKPGPSSPLRSLGGSPLWPSSKDLNHNSYVLLWWGRERKRTWALKTQYWPLLTGLVEGIGKLFFPGEATIIKGNQ